MMGQGVNVDKMMHRLFHSKLKAPIDLNFGQALTGKIYYQNWAYEKNPFCQTPPNIPL